MKSSWKIALICTPLFLGGCWDMGTGEKIGAITRLQRTGVFCQTWEGEIIRGGLNGGSGVVGNAFHFTVEDEALAKKVHEYMEKQQEVKITYRQEGATLCRSDSDNMFLTDIQPVGAVATPPTQSKELASPTPAPTAVNSNDAIVQLLQQNNELLQELKRDREGHGDSTKQ